jgi:hypothetical protein
MGVQPLSAEQFRSANSGPSVSQGAAGEFAHVDSPKPSGSQLRPQTETAHSSSLSTDTIGSQGALAWTTSSVARGRSGVLPYSAKFRKTTVDWGSSGTETRLPNSYSARAE